MNTRLLIAAMTVTVLVMCQQLRAQDEPIMPEATELEGTWELVSRVIWGEQEETNGTFWRFEGNRWYAQRGIDENWKLKGTFSLNPSMMPAEIDHVIFLSLGMEILDLPGRGIYELDDDLLRVCFSISEEFEPGPRPDVFESTEDPQTNLYVLRRVTEKETE